MSRMEEYQEQIRQELSEIESKEGWNSRYQKIRMESIYNEYSCTEAKAPCNKLLNRYRDVSPFDHSRVILNKGPCSYINASVVKVNESGRTYILTQGPLPQTAGHFWLMVWEQRSKAVLMLNKVIEKNQIKCHQYWPVGSKNGGHDDMEFDDVGIKLVLRKEEELRHFIVRTFSLEDMSTGNSREVLQFHYTTWPDFGVPSTPRAFLHFLQVVRDSGALNSNVGPPIVHCSAGIGRSGTFCLVDSCLLMMEEGKPVNINEILLEMRRYRMGLIQTADQLRFSYLAIIEGITQLAEGKKRFLADEENGDLIELDDKPLPPRRIDSLPQNPVAEELFRRLIEDRQFVNERPLPETPSSDDVSDSSDDSSSDELEDEEDEIVGGGDGDVAETTKNIPTNGSALNHNNHHHLHSSSSDANNGSSKTNGVEGASEENVARRRLKNEALREKIREIKAHQKESEAMKGIHRSPEAKRRKSEPSTTRSDDPANSMNRSASTRRHSQHR
ncbi:tyrosine-protein phosphatase non-receptor type 1 isoform X1 [Folsomia candida]|uniref:tyrosine-protein phosphatase non-receptor type 1 isoform X1 n=1 Tax=Folsomia candida TaxID=158441 RepID=UPI000B8FA062|nr:tyrosine-protein phosphatase non-receptor type 1 isoform X1 [Folsomia candida]